jgi:cell division septation protein DedD
MDRSNTQSIRNGWRLLVGSVGFAIGSILLVARGVFTLPMALSCRRFSGFLFTPPV